MTTFSDAPRVLPTPDPYKPVVYRSPVTHKWFACFYSSGTWHRIPYATWREALSRVNMYLWACSQARA